MQVELTNPMQIPLTINDLQLVCDLEDAVMAQSASLPNLTDAIAQGKPMLKQLAIVQKAHKVYMLVHMFIMGYFCADADGRLHTGEQ